MPSEPFPRLPCDPGAIARALSSTTGPVLLLGAPGTGKSTLARRLAMELAERGERVRCLGADPGSPAFGLPGALSLADWDGSDWKPQAFEALCTLDAGRFRLPLIESAGSLLGENAPGILLVDAPGVVRGVAGRELTSALCRLLPSPGVLLLTRDGAERLLVDALRTWASRVWCIDAPSEAARPGKRIRARERTRLWDAWLEQAIRQRFRIDALPVIGNPPPPECPEAWTGRQVGLLRAGMTLTLGEIERLADGWIELRAPPVASAPDALLVRDAQRQPDGLLGSAEPHVPSRPDRIHSLPPAQAPTHESAPITGRCGPLDFMLVNGVFGDPLLHLRLRHAGRSLLFDLGEVARLPTRLAHQITDVFVSHAHMDHLGGFLWLLRARLGEFPACRLYGPPGLARHVASFVDSFLWDRIGDNGPAFEVHELHEERLRRWRIQAGWAECTELPPLPARDGIMREETGFRIRAIELDHHTPVLAFAFEPDRELHVRKDRLQERGLQPGPWLGELKAAILADHTERMIALPDGTASCAGALADELLRIQPAKRLVYATDLADTPANRQRLVDFARGAHTFFCEAPFRERESENADRNGHLTTRACAEIAREAHVSRLVPFHFSRRYQDDAEAVYEEIAVIFPYLLRD